MPPIQRSIMDFLKPKKQETATPTTPKPATPITKTNISRVIKTPSPKQFQVNFSQNSQNTSPSIDVSKFYSPSLSMENLDIEVLSNAQAKQTPMHKQYNFLRSQLEPETVFFLQNGAFFELYEQDATFGANYLQLRVAQKTEGMIMSGVPMVQGDFFIKRTIACGKRVCVAVQFSSVDPKFKVVKRDISYFLSPGLINDPSFIQGSNFGLLFVEENAAIFIDTIRYIYRKFEYKNEEELQELIILISPAEILTQNAKIATLCKIYVPCVTNVCQGYFIAKELKFNYFPAVLNEYLSYMRVSDLIEDDFVKNEQKTAFIASSSCYSLNIESQTGYSILKTINFTCTKQGFQFLRKLILQPFCDKENIVQHQKLIQYMQNFKFDKLKSFQKQLKQCIDYEKYTYYVIKQTEFNKIPVQQFQSLITSLQKGVEFLLNFQDQFFTPFINKQNIQDIQMLLTTFNQNFTITSSTLTLHQSNSEFQSQKDSQVDFNAQLLQYLRDLKLAYVTSPELPKSLSSQDSRSFLGFTPSPNRFLIIGKDVLKSEVDLNKFKNSSKLTYISSTATVHKFEFPKQFAEQEYQLLERSKNALQISISGFISELKTDEIATFSEQIALLDFAISMAVLPLKYSTFNWCFPTIFDSEKAEISFQEAVHLIALTQKINWIPQTFQLSTPSILTGANTSGKSTLLRTVGTLALLAQIGAPVPAKQLQISPFREILCRIGGSISANSTFAAECLETSFLLNSAGGKSLLLIDEIGRGTEVVEGDSLAQGIVIQLQKQCICGIISTHSSPVRALGKVAGIRVINMKSDILGGKLVNEYKIDEVSQKSHGIEAARVLGLDEEVLARAEILRTEMIEKRRYQLYCALIRASQGLVVKSE